MARIRSIKPGFFRSEDVSVLPFRARLTWVGLWTICDDHGRAKDSTRLIKGDLWSLEDHVTLDDVADDLDVLAAHERIVRYSVAGRDYLAVVNWHLHQAINRPGQPTYPGPPIATGPVDPDERGYCKHCCGTPEQLTTDSLIAHGTLTSGRGRGKGREREGERATQLSESPAVDPGLAQEPPRRCPKHETSRNPGPCGACADARHEHEAWQRTHVAASILRPLGPRCQDHPEHPAGRCPVCESAAVPPPESLRHNRKPREAS